MDTFPTDETGRALQEFQRNGFDLSKPMEIDFFVAVPSEAEGDEVAIKAKSMGFQASVERDDETGVWTCYCTRVLIPNYSNIVRTEEELSEVARPLGGFTDGFGSRGNVYPIE